MLKIRYFFRLVWAFIKRFKGILIVGIAVGIGLFFLSRFIAPALFGHGQDRIGVAGRFQTDNLPAEILSLVSRGLTKVDESGFPEPDLASSWETPDKGKTWIFHLKDNLYWQDGKKVTSKTIDYNFSDVEVEKPDEKTIVFKLKEPFSPFPGVVSRPVFKQGLLGIGDWKVTKASLVSNYIQTLVIRSPDRHKKTYRFYPTEERAKLALKLGDLLFA